MAHAHPMDTHPFTNRCQVMIPHAVHGLGVGPLRVQVWGGDLPARRLLYDSAAPEQALITVVCEIAEATGDVMVTFVMPESGQLVVRADAAH
jgi:hypothetical protein